MLLQLKTKGHLPQSTTTALSRFCLCCQLTANPSTSCQAWLSKSHQGEFTAAKLTPPGKPVKNFPGRQEQGVLHCNLQHSNPTSSCQRKDSLSAVPPAPQALSK